jgi:hypothetical protein
MLQMFRDFKNQQQAYGLMNPETTIIYYYENCALHHIVLVAPSVLGCSDRAEKVQFSSEILRL